MNSPYDTIAAISTPIGQGGIGIVRLSGPDALAIAGKVFRPRKKGAPFAAGTRCMLYGHAIDPADGKVVDEALLSVMPAPNSYTREDVAELNCHGGLVSVRTVLEIVLSQGARLAEPGEFTKRAFLNGRISLDQAEAVSDLIAAKTGEGLRIAMEQLRGGLSGRLSGIREKLLEICALVEAHIDFPEEEIWEETSPDMTERLSGLRKEIEGLSRTFEEARFFGEGLSVAIVGRPNVGKSSLLNALLQKEKAIVTEIPGTTRDLVEDFLNIDGLPVRIIDTAGIRHSDETVEREGIRRSIETMEKADFVILVLDGSEEMKEDDSSLLQRMRGRNGMIVLNKSDLATRISPQAFGSSGLPAVSASARTGEGLDEMKKVVYGSNLRNWREEREGVVVTNLRHKAALDKASLALERGLGLLRERGPLELLAFELRDGLDRIGEITGAVTTDEILDRIFTNFCIGK